MTEVGIHALMLPPWQSPPILSAVLSTKKMTPHSPSWEPVVLKTLIMATSPGAVVQW